MKERTDLLSGKIGISLGRPVGNLDGTSLRDGSASQLLAKAFRGAGYAGIKVDLPQTARDALLNKFRATPLNSQLAESESAQSGRIIHGIDATPGDFPWQVAILLRGFREDRINICGGTLIDSTHVLTAAHCFKDKSSITEFSKDDIDVVIGTVNYQDPKYERIDLVAVAIHPKYDKYSYEHDLAVLTLSKPQSQANSLAIWNKSPFQYPLVDGATLWITGWGYTNNDGTRPNILQVAPIPTVDETTCRAAPGYATLLKIGMICAGFKAGGVDSCSGDSGGPALYRGPLGNPQKPALYAVVSWGMKGHCGDKTYYGVYTAVQPHGEWIVACLSNKGSSICPTT